MTQFWKWFRVVGIVAVILVSLLLFATTSDKPSNTSSDTPVPSMFRK